MDKKFYKTIVFIVKIFMKIFYPFEIRGAENCEGIKGGYVICSNHLSNFDPIFLMISHKRPICFMAKEELFKNKFFSWFFTKMGAFAVKRGRNDKGALLKSENIIKSGEILGIFIEGTRSKTGEFLRPKAGATLIAKNTGANIVPVCITGVRNDNKIGIFRKTIVSYGSPITQGDLNIIEGSRMELKLATELIMNGIKKQRD